MEMKKVDCKALAPRERVLIYTGNSLYEFTLRDPQSCTGMLSGGVLGETPVSASLLWSAIDGKTGELFVLTLEAKATFIYASPTGNRRLITSPIRKLTRA
jgi:hypothetical protein